MKAGDRGTDRDKVGFGRAAVREMRAQGRGVGVAVHHDRVLDGARVALGRHGQAAAPARHERDDLAVVPWREAAVELELGVTARPSPLERAVVDERELDRLLDLVGRRFGEKDPGDVGLAQLHRRRLSVGGGVQERVREADRGLDCALRATVFERWDDSHGVPFPRARESPMLPSNGGRAIGSKLPPRRVVVRRLSSGPPDGAGAIRATITVRPLDAITELDAGLRGRAGRLRSWTRIRV